jgi:hypothetical protein
MLWFICKLYSMIDKNSMAETVNKYYTALQNQQFSQALSYCFIDDTNNDLHMDINSRVDCQKELWKHVYSTFKFNDLQTSGGSIYIQKDKTEKAYRMVVSYQISYTNTRGGTLDEIVFLRKINNVWKIVKLEFCDRYVCYRVGKYKYVREFF